MQTYQYNICGLTLDFPWKIQGFPLSTKAPDAHIQFGPVHPPSPNEIGYEGPYCQAAQNHFFLNIDNVAHFMVCDGNRITIAPQQDVDTDSLQTFILSTCLGVLLIQRKLLVLHAAVLAKNGKTVAFGGGPGSGKSTLCGLMLASGAKVMTDNIATIHFDDEATAIAHPSFPNIHLWQPTLEKLAPHPQNAKRLRPELNKYALGLGEDFINMPQPLSTLCILSPWNQSDIRLESITGSEKLFQLANVGFRTKITRGLGMDKQYFQHIGLLSKTVNMVKLSYPQDWALNDTLVQYIDENLFT